jgi:hypothetical protein
VDLSAAEELALIAVLRFRDGPDVAVGISQGFAEDEGGEGSRRLVGSL